MEVKTVQQAQPQPSSKLAGTIIGLVIIVVLAVIVNKLSKNVSGTLEYPLWAAALGLLANLIMSATRTKDFIQPAIRTELFLKIGLVLLGASVNFTKVMSVGAKGIVQGLIMITCVFFFTYWLGGKFKLSDTLKATMATAISVCGVSAAIAAAGAVLAKKEELAYITALVIFTALPLMVLMPWLAVEWNLPVQVAGAWFGGNIDTTAAVVGAGAIHGEEAMKIASIVKMSQNALIGFVAFALAVYFATKVEKSGQGVSAKVIWDRFPKFVLGFMITSILASTGFFAKEALGAIGNMQKWFFNLAFICIGLELAFGALKQIGGKPLVVYIIATIFNTTLALGVGWLIFGGILGI
ncbi:hypothetical protein SY88_16190 [Clostridiales bacterium PH28_bin88]|nr:hypothetical protein SY88_16190 [Clostridiales bacterium PH28_bin88]